MPDQTSSRKTINCVQCGEETSSTEPDDNLCLACVSEIVNGVMEGTDPDGDPVIDNVGEELARVNLELLLQETERDSFESFFNTLTEFFNSHPGQLRVWQDFTWQNRQFSIRRGPLEELQFRLRQSDDTDKKVSPFALIDTLSALE
jgi:hypothetical protein